MKERDFFLGKKTGDDMKETNNAVHATHKTGKFWRFIHAVHHPHCMLCKILEMPRKGV